MKLAAVRSHNPEDGDVALIQYPVENRIKFEGIFIK